MEQIQCSETLAYKIQMPGITQKKAYTIRTVKKYMDYEEETFEWHIT